MPHPTNRKLAMGKKKIDALKADQLRAEYKKLLALQKQLEAQNQVWRTDVEVVTIDVFWHTYLHRAEPSPRQWEFIHALCGTEAKKWPSEYQEIIAMVGQKGGKNWIVEGCLVYTLYKLCCMMDPHKYFGIDPSKTISLTNSSLKGERQAREVFFDNVKATMKLVTDPKTGMNWFEHYIGMDFEKAGDMQTKSILLPSAKKPKIKVHSFDSTPDAPEGLLVLWGIMDEPSRANTPPKYRDAKKLRRVLRGNSIGAFKGYGKTILFSYPEQEIGDLTYDRFEQVRTSTKGRPTQYGFERPGVYAIKAATWEFDTTKKKSDYDGEYEEDPIDAACRFECIVPKARFGFFKPYDHKIRECAYPTPQPPIVAYAAVPTTKIVRDATTKQIKRLTFTGIQVAEIKGDNRERVIALDAGVNKDRFVICGGYMEALDVPKVLRMTKDLKEKGEELDTEEQRASSVDPALALETITARPVIDWFVYWEPKGGSPVDYSDVERFVTEELIPAFPYTRLIVSDRYNAETLKSKVTDLGYEYQTLGFSNAQQLKGYHILRRYVWNNIVRYVDDPLLLMEMEQLLKMTTGKLDHPIDGSKDAADSLMLCTTKLIELLAADAAAVPEESVGQLQERFNKWLVKFARENKRAPTPDEVRHEFKVKLDLALALLEDVDVDLGQNPVQEALAHVGVFETQAETLESMKAAGEIDY